MAQSNRDNNRRHTRVRAATIVPRPWGREVCYASEPHYEARILEVKKGHGFTPELNEFLTRTMHVLSGAVWFQLNGIEFDLIPGACLTIRPGDAHCLHALEDSVVLEVRNSEVADDRPADSTNNLK